MSSLVFRRFGSVVESILKGCVYMCVRANTTPLKMDPKRRVTTEYMDISKREHDNSQIHNSFIHFIQLFKKVGGISYLFSDVKSNTFKK